MGLIPYALLIMYTTVRIAALLITFYCRSDENV